MLERPLYRSMFGDSARLPMKFDVMNNMCLYASQHSVCAQTDIGAALHARCYTDVQYARRHDYNAGDRGIPERNHETCVTFRRARRTPQRDIDLRSG